MKFTVNEIDGNWVVGTYGKKGFEAKIFIEPSVYGIDSGRVSKFHFDGISYERGWNDGRDRRDEWAPLIAKLEAFAQTERFVKSFERGE